MEMRTYLPGNSHVGRAEDGRIIEYYSFGATADYAGLMKAFSVEDYIETTLFQSELNRMALDALNATEVRDNSYISLFDFSGGSESRPSKRMTQRSINATLTQLLSSPGVSKGLGKALNAMECEFLFP